MRCITEKSHAVFIVLGLLSNFLPIFTLLGPTAGPGSCLQKHCKDRCPFWWSPLLGSGSDGRSVLLGLWGWWTTGPWGYCVRMVDSYNWLAFPLNCCIQNRMEKKIVACCFPAARTCRARVERLSRYVSPWVTLWEFCPEHRGWHQLAILFFSPRFMASSFCYSRFNCTYQHPTLWSFLRQIPYYFFLHSQTLLCQIRSSFP